MQKALAREDFAYFGKWVAPTLAWSLGRRWASGKLLRDLSLATRGELLVLDGHGFYTRQSLADIKELFRKPAEALDRSFFKRFLTYTDVTFDAFTALLDLSDTDEIRARFALFFERYEEVWCPWMTAFFASKTLEDELTRRAVSQGLDPAAVLGAVRPARKNLSGIAKGEMAELMRRGSALTEEEIDAYVAKWGWIGTHHFWGTPLTRERFQEESATLVLEDTAPAYGQYSDDVRFLLEEAGTMSWIRTQSAELSAMVSYRLRPLFNAAATALDLTYDDLIFMHQGEILAGLAGEPIDRDAVMSRKKLWGGYFSPEELLIFSEDETRRLAKEFVPAAAAGITEVRGTVASKGYAIGKARVVFLPHEAPDFAAGDILIAPETAPDYLPLMHKAGAIVTDRGGVTSHAAITSRELGKPCVIGTEIASEVFRDGETVEVDAAQGVVRKAAAKK